jgi:hypothetical protein
MIAVSTVALLLTLADRRLMPLAGTRRHPAARPAPDPAGGPGTRKEELNQCPYPLWTTGRHSS